MKLSNMAKRMMLIVIISLFALIAGSVIYYRSTAFLPFAYGAFLGTALNAAKIIMLDRTVKRVVAMEALQAGNYARVQHLLKFLLTGLVLVVAAVVPFINIWGTASGVLSYQIAVYSLKYFKDPDTKSTDKTDRIEE